MDANVRKNLSYCASTGALLHWNCFGHATTVLLVWSIDPAQSHHLLRSAPWNKTESTQIRPRRWSDFCLPFRAFCIKADLRGKDMVSVLSSTKQRVEDSSIPLSSQDIWLPSFHECYLTVAGCQTLYAGRSIVPKRVWYKVTFLDWLMAVFIVGRSLPCEDLRTSPFVGLFTFRKRASLDSKGVSVRHFWRWYGLLSKTFKKHAIMIYSYLHSWKLSLLDSLYHHG